MFSVERTLSTIHKEANNKTKVTNPETALGWSLHEDIGSSDDDVICVIFNDMYRITRPVVSFRAIKINNVSRIFPQEHCEHSCSFI
jgi:hypothetical protein